MTPTAKPSASSGEAMEMALSTSVRSSLAAVLLEHGIDEVEDESCLNVLEHMVMKQIMKLAALTQSFGELAMRSQAHFSDAIMAVAFTGVDIPALKTYLLSEYKYPRLLEGLKMNPDFAQAQPAPTVFQSGSQRRLPRYIPDYYPPVPSVYTFENTPVQKQNKLDYKQARERIASEKRQIEQSLHGFHHRTVGRFDSPFNLQDPCFSLLPATHHLEQQPAYLSALIPPKNEDRRIEELTRKEAEKEKRREAEDEEPESHPRKYKKHAARKDKREPRRNAATTSSSRKSKKKEDSLLMDDSNSNIFSPNNSL